MKAYPADRRVFRGMKLNRGRPGRKGLQSLRGTHIRPTGKSRKLELSRLGKEDRLIPVITQVLYIGKEPWDAVKNLHGILDLSKIPEGLLEYIPDYQIQVLDVCHTSDERLLEFPSDISCMFLSMKCCDIVKKK